MKMVVAFVLGVAVLGIGFLFCPPLRDRAEMLLFAQGEATADHKAQLEEQPLREAADAAKTALKSAFESASHAVARKDSRDEAGPAGAADTSWNAGAQGLDVAAHEAPFRHRIPA
jgi:hypothetical protein